MVVKADPNGWTPHGFAEKLLQEGQKYVPSINMNMLNYAIDN
jgi:hypothetical protein